LIGTEAIILEFFMNDKTIRDEALMDYADDPILAMRAIGKHLWAQEPGDAFVERLRSEDLLPAMKVERNTGADLQETVWRRLASRQREEFRTATGLPFTFEIDGSGIWFFRNGKRINKKLSRKQLNLAISRCPLSKTTEIADLMDYAYLFGILRDARIKGEAW
jgi:hypothetical protein